jgi:O-acetylserine/cysteine efflux transporter
MPLRDGATAMLIALLWGFNFVVMKVGVGEVPPLALAALRFGLAAIPLVLFFPRPACSWRLVIGFGLLFGVVKFGLLFIGMRLGMPAGLSSVVLQSQALLTIVLAGLLLKERVTRSQAIGLAVAVVGLSMLASDWIAAAPLLPFLLVFAAAVAWAFANVIAKRAAGTDPMSFTVWTALVAAVPLIALCVVVEGLPALTSAFGSVTWRGIGAILYLAYPISLLSVALWNSLLQRHSAAALAPFPLLVPVVGLALGHVLLGEPISRAMLIGAGLVLIGLAVAMIGPHRTGRSATDGALGNAEKI